MRLLPRSLFGQLALFLAVGLALAQLLSAALLLQDRDQALSHVLGGHIAQRIAAIVELLDTLDRAERRRLVAALDLPPTRLSLDLPWADDLPADERYHTTLFRALLRRQLGAERPFQLHISDELPEPPPPPPPPLGAEPRRGPPHWRMRAMMLGLRNFVVQVRLADGTVATFQQVLPEEVLAWPARLLLILLILLVSVALVAALAVRALIQPLTVLARAANDLGRDIHQPPLSETGPLEVRDAARAFNTMQGRLIRYIEDRDRLLAAVSHDLKTPITRLRLRAELLDDPLLRDKIQGDLDDMQHLVQASLDFLRGGDYAEPMVPTDVDALLESLQEDVEDTGFHLAIQGTTLAPLRCRPLALKRCLGNLVDNALHYGRDVGIVVCDTPERLTLRVCDRGPGIPEAQLEQVFAPFYRLEGSRSRDTGGTGLGLSIARGIARAHGGELSLRNRVGGGLDAVLELPR